MPKQKAVKKPISKATQPKPAHEKKLLKLPATKKIKPVARSGKEAPSKESAKPQQLNINTLNIGKIEPRPLVDEMQESYLDYAMSVIVARALPDVRDGLKPVHRKILYAMWSIGLKSGARFKKSAAVVGEVLAKYHPHGDSATYESMAHMAQDFSLRYPLVWGQGNFGSIDGDSPAAMRYTEAKLKSIAEEMLADLDKDTVDWVPNYDGSQKEPGVLPAKLPQLLLNGTMGIAVGMATSIPSHNLGEIVDGVCHLIDNPEATVEELMRFIKGPDFPTGATVYDIEEIKRAYATGRGSIVTRADAEIVENNKGDFAIIISSLPYKVNKASLLEKIADLVKDKKIDGIRDLRDESAKGDIRIVIELKKDTYPKKILNVLYKHTQLQDTFHVNMVALVDGIQPRIMTLKMVLEEYIKHRQEVITRRTKFELEKARDRTHILEGLMLALNKIDAVIKTIKASKDREAAKVNLMRQFKLTEKQAVAILEMKLQQLANLERLKIETELKEKKKLIAELTAILKNPAKILKIIRDELTYIKDKFADARRTKIIKGTVDKFSMEDLVPDESTMVVVTKDGYVKRLPPDIFKTQGRGGKGVLGLTTKEEDAVEHFFTTTTHKDILFFTTRGRVFQLKAYEIPVSSRIAKGQAIVNFLQLSPEEKVSSVLSLADTDKYKHIIMVTRTGTIKKVDISALTNVRRSGLIAIKLKNDDKLEWVEKTTGMDEIILVTTNGQSIRFKEKDLRSMGRAASGVRGIRLKGKDGVVGMSVINKLAASSGALFVLTKNGFGKLTSLKNYRLQSRGGSGIKTAKITSKTGEIVSGFMIDAQRLPEELTGDLIIISHHGQVIRLPLKSVPTHGRQTQGVCLMRFKEPGDHTASVTLI